MIDYNSLEWHRWRRS